jgi:hypothetical protein
VGDPLRWILLAVVSLGLLLQQWLTPDWVGQAEAWVVRIGSLDVG